MLAANFRPTAVLGLYGDNGKEHGYTCSSPPHAGVPQHEATLQQPLFNTPQKSHLQFVIVLNMGAGTRLTMTKNVGGRAGGGGWWIPKMINLRYFSGGPHNKGYSIWGSLLGSPYFWKLSYLALSPKSNTLTP